MSQSGKVLHLYVEVRANAAKQDGKGEEDSTTTESVVTAEEVAKQMLGHLANAASSIAAGNKNPSTSQSPSSSSCSTSSSSYSTVVPRHPPNPKTLAGYQLHQRSGGDTPSNTPTRIPHPPLRHTGIEGEFVSAGNRTPQHFHVPLPSPSPSPSPSPGGGVAARQQQHPSSSLPGCEEEEGRVPPPPPPGRQKSVVTFSYVEKSSVQKIKRGGGGRAGVGDEFGLRGGEADHDERSTPLYLRKRPMEAGRDGFGRGVGLGLDQDDLSTPLHLRKRLSDPVWFGSPDSSCSNSPKLRSTSSPFYTPSHLIGGRQATFDSPAHLIGGRQPTGASPAHRIGGYQTAGTSTVNTPTRRSTLDSAVGRAATQRALEDFGSPLLRCRFAHELERGLLGAQGRPGYGYGHGYGYGFGSPQHGHARCQSWAGSPVPARNPGTVPCRGGVPLATNVKDDDATGGNTVLDRLSSQDGRVPETVQVGPNPGQHAGPGPGPNLNPTRVAYGIRPSSYTSSNPPHPETKAHHDHSRRPHSASGTGFGPTTQAATTTTTTSSNRGIDDLAQRGGHRVRVPASNSGGYSPVTRKSTTPNPPSRSTESPPQCGRRSSSGSGRPSPVLTPSPVHSPEVARKLAEEATKVSEIFNEVRSSATPPPHRPAHHPLNTLSGPTEFWGPEDLCTTTSHINKYNVDGLTEASVLPGQRRNPPMAMNIPLTGGGVEMGVLEQNLIGPHHHQPNIKALPFILSSAQQEGPQHTPPPANHVSGQGGHLTQRANDTREQRRRTPSLANPIRGQRGHSSPQSNEVRGQIGLSSSPANDVVTGKQEGGLAPPNNTLSPPPQYPISPAGRAPVSPAIPSRLLRPVLPNDEGWSPVRDPGRRRLSDLQLPHSPSLHHRQPPPYKGRDSWFPCPERSTVLGHESCGGGGPGGEQDKAVEVARRLFLSQGVQETPVSWTSREEEWGSMTSRRKRSGRERHGEEEERRRRRSSRDEGEPRPILTHTQTDSQTQNQNSVPLSPKQVRRQKQAEQRRREALLLGPVALDLHRGHDDDDDEDDDDDAEVGGQGRGPLLRVDGDIVGDSGSGGPPGGSGSSRSSSGVTGSIGDRDCISPESSHSSQQSTETGHGTSGIQSDSSSVLAGPSLHCQKMARAKWEFLFGGPTEDRGGKIPGTAPPSGTSSESPTPTPPPTFLELVTMTAANHEVQQVELELVTTPPDVAPATGYSSYFAPSPKTCVLRRTLRYSETDLDAVPLRCYRETDIDEVLRAAAATEMEDADSAFGSNRSVFGMSGAGSSPLGMMTMFGEGQGEEEEEEEDDDDDESDEEDEDEDEQEVASWVSVRMLGDARRQLANQKQEEMFSVVLRRPLETFFEYPPVMKSPLLISSHPHRRCSGNDMDTFSRHFEAIMESGRAKGTSYSSLESLDLWTSSTQTVFTFDLPTLTPKIQGQVYQSARQIVQLSFAPLAHCELPSRSDSVLTVTGGSSDATRAPSSEMLSSGSDDTLRSIAKGPSVWKSNSLPRDKPGHHHANGTNQDQGSSDTLTNGNRADREAARRLAKRLFKQDGFRKSDVARHLSKNNDFSRMVAEEYVRHFNFAGLTLDLALRMFLQEFVLMGETQERERVLAHFSRRYLHCNPRLNQTEDSIHTLTCALMLLNSDLHGNNVGKRMSCTQFISNLEGLNEGRDYPKDMLKRLYNSIKTEKLQWTIDEEELRKSFSELGETRGDPSSHGDAPASGALLYKHSFLIRKVIADCDGKRTPRGKRGWKTFYAVLKGLIIYLQKGEYKPDKHLSEEDLKNAVSIHHALAMEATDYSKRPNVFYLRTADWRVYLFQAPNPEQMQSWITRINTVAAMFSAPPLPAAIGSQKKFSRPLLPGSASKLTQEEQVQAHESRLRGVSTELVELRSYPPDRKVKGRELDEYRQREEYLEFEKTRYGTYMMLLRLKLRISAGGSSSDGGGDGIAVTGDEDLSLLEAQLLEEGGLHRAISSPTLEDLSLASSIRDPPSKASAITTTTMTVLEPAPLESMGATGGSSSNTTTATTTAATVNTAGATNNTTASNAGAGVANATATSSGTSVAAGHNSSSGNNNHKRGGASGGASDGGQRHSYRQAVKK